MPLKSVKRIFCILWYLLKCTRKYSIWHYWQENLKHPTCSGVSGSDKGGSICDDFSSSNESATGFQARWSQVYYHEHTTCTKYEGAKWQIAAGFVVWAEFDPYAS